MRTRFCLSDANFPNDPQRDSGTPACEKCGVDVEEGKELCEDCQEEHDTCCMCKTDYIKWDMLYCEENHMCLDCQKQDAIEQGKKMDASIVLFSDGYGYHAEAFWDWQTDYQDSSIECAFVKGKEIKCPS